MARHTIDMNYRSFIDDERVDWFIFGPSDDYLRKHTGNTKVLTIDGSIVGFAVCKEDLIDLIMIDHESHRRGLGSVLLAHCEMELFEHYDAIRLESFEGNTKANRFYRKNGWTRIGVGPDTMSDGRKWIFEKRRHRRRLEDHLI